MTRSYPPAPHAYGVEVLVNAASSSPYWRLEDEDVCDTAEQAENLREQLIEDVGYDATHLRVVSLTALYPPDQADHEEADRD